jgi:lysyl-tRNA synthetase class 2
VETPMLHPIPGGAAAKPFVTHHNVLDADLYLRIAPELYLKRLVVGGFERVYELNRNFRNEGVSTRHNPEFTAVEWYIAHHDYVWMMDFTETLIKAVAQEVCDDITHIPYGQYVLDFTQPFARMSMAQAVAQYANCIPADLQSDAINTLVAKYNVKVAVGASWGYALYALFEQLVEPNLIQPTFITEFPVEVSPLAKRNADNPALTDRFELFVAHMEIANAFTELNDPFDQAARCKQQAAAKTAGDEEAHAYDADFIHALEYGMPPTVGAGIGVDRLVMLLTNTTSIKDVILFPALKKK